MNVIHYAPGDCSSLQFYSLQKEIFISNVLCCYKNNGFQLLSLEKRRRTIIPGGLQIKYTTCVTTD